MFDLCSECMTKANSLKKTKCILCQNSLYKSNHIFCDECYNKYVQNNESEYFTIEDLLIELNDIIKRRYKTLTDKYDKIGRLYNIRNQIKKTTEDNGTILFDDFLAKCYDILHQNTNQEDYPKLTTKDKHQVRSRGELIIDNYLYDNNIRHLYEITLILNNKPVNPDFYLPDFDVYIEYWGYDENSQDREMADAYEQRKQEKIELYKQNNIKLIEIENKDFEDIYTKLNNIFEKLTKNDLPF